MYSSNKLSYTTVRYLARFCLIMLNVSAKLAQLMTLLNDLDSLDSKRDELFKRRQKGYIYLQMDPYRKILKKRYKYETQGHKTIIAER